MGNEASMAKVKELLEEYQNLKRTPGGLIYFITTKEGKSFAKRIQDIKYNYENPELLSLDQTHVGTLMTLLPRVKKDIEKLCEERGLQ